MLICWEIYTHALESFSMEWWLKINTNKRWDLVMVVEYNLYNISNWVGCLEILHMYITGYASFITSNHIEKVSSKESHVVTYKEIFLRTWWRGSSNSFFKCLILKQNLCGFQLYGVNITMSFKMYTLKMYKLRPIHLAGGKMNKLRPIHLAGGKMNKIRFLYIYISN